MGIFSSIRDAVVATTKPVISLAEATDESLTVATSYIHNRAVAHKLTDKQEVMVSTAESMLALEAKLNADKDLKAIYDKLDKEFA